MRKQSLLIALATVLSAIAIGALFMLVRPFDEETKVKASPNGKIGITVDEGITEENIKSRFTQADILKYTNEYRLSKGLGALALNESLNSSACAKAEDMKARNYWSHNAPDGTQPWHFFDQIGYQYTKAGENLAYGHKDAPSVVHGWINSPTHEANLTGDYTEMGVCTVYAEHYFNAVNPTAIIVAHYATPYRQ